MTPVGVPGIGVASDDIGGVGEGLEGLAKPFPEGGVGSCRVLLVPSVDGDEGDLVVWVKGGADVDC